MTFEEQIKKSWPDLAFGILWAGTLISIFQLFCESPISHPIWSTVFGFPFLHHAYYLHIGLIIPWMYIRKWVLFMRFARAFVKTLRR